MDSERAMPKPLTYPEEFDVIPRLKQLDLPTHDYHLIASTMLELCELRDLANKRAAEIDQLRAERDSLDNEVSSFRHAFRTQVDMREQTLKRCIAIVEDYALDALPDSEYRLACYDLVEAFRALNGGQQDG